MTRQWMSPKWGRLDELELLVVRRFATLANVRGIRVATKIVNTLADGWIYLPIALILSVCRGIGRQWILETAVSAALISHLVHAILKRWLVRSRPFDRDKSLAPIGAVLDRYAFPSGHCMTMVCVSIPIVHQLPALWLIAVPNLAVVSACRIIAAHHYPSDVVAGLSIGATVAGALCASDLFA